jgi:hypothetical protein
MRSGRYCLTIVVFRVGILHAGKNLDDLEIAVPEWSVSQILDQQLVGMVIARLPKPDVSYPRRVEFNVIESQADVRAILVQERLDVLRQ